MSEARTAILSTLRRKRGSLSEDHLAQLEKRLSQPPRGLIPARAQGPHSEQIELFTRMAEAASASVARVASVDQVPEAIQEFLVRYNLPTEIVVAPTADFDSLPWYQQERLRVERRAARNGDRVTVSPAFAGIAETGTLMLLSGHASPSTLNFLPDAHIVVVSADRIAGPYEDAWQWLRQEQETLPRTINLITGPSRSADIEQTLQLGAHGPIELHIILVSARHK